MPTNPQTLRKIRSFYAKKNNRVGDKWATTYEVKAGIVVVQCKANGRVYIAKSTNVRRTVSRWNTRLRSGNIPGFTEINNDLQRYGSDQFVVKVGETLDHVPAEYIDLRLNMLFRDYTRKIGNLYNRREVATKYIPLFERAKYQALGGTTGRNEQIFEKHAELYGVSAVLVVTCKSTGMHLVCATGDLGNQWFKIINKLRKGIFRVSDMQEDWNKYGEDQFVGDFYRVPDGNSRLCKRMVLRSLHGIYRVPRPPRAGSSTPVRGELAS